MTSKMFNNSIDHRKHKRYWISEAVRFCSLVSIGALIYIVWRFNIWNASELKFTSYVAAMVLLLIVTVCAGVDLEPYTHSKNLFNIYAKGSIVFGLGTIASFVVGLVFWVKKILQVPKMPEKINIAVTCLIISLTLFIAMVSRLYVMAFGRTPDELSSPVIAEHQSVTKQLHQRN
jgi:uncharacterized membrane protein